MRWAIELQKVDGDREFARALIEEVGFHFIDVHDSFPKPHGDAYITAGSLDALSSNNDVLNEAKRLQAAIADSPDSLFEGARPAIELGAMLEHHEGAWRRYITCELVATLSAASSLTGTLTVSVENMSPEALAAREASIREMQRREEQARLQRAARYAKAHMQEPLVREVLHWLKMPASGDSLGKIDDIIKDHAGNRLWELASKTQISRFRRSINHPDVLGRDARHAVMATDPPPDPMSLEEASAFARTLVDAWVAMIAEQVD